LFSFSIKSSYTHPYGQPAPSKPSTLTILQLQNGELPPELDFFKYAESRTNTDAKGKGKEKAPENKRDKKSKGGGTSIEEHAKSHKRKRKDGGDGTETEEDVMDVDGNEGGPVDLCYRLRDTQIQMSHLDPKEASTSTSTPIAHRITATGSNVPSPITSFEDLSERYNVPSRLLQNVSQNGYITPTGIQSQGVTILLEVDAFCFLR
jgi:ATP-dependent RNA helicase DDX52/ROK1